MTIVNETKGNYYIIADHLRTAIFALADGATFGPKGRGYVLKKLVKKATLSAYFLGLNSEQLQKVSEKLIEINSSYHKHLKAKESEIISELRKEIDKSMKFISKSAQEIDNCYTPRTTVADIFFWYDTKGIPEELIRFYLEKKGHKFPKDDFDKLLEGQKKKSLKDRQGKNLSIF